jgi:hypothetical protein
MMRVVGSAEPPGGKPTIRRIGLFGYWAKAGAAQARSAKARTSLSFFTGFPPGGNSTAKVALVLPDYVKRRQAHRRIDGVAG